MPPKRGQKRKAGSSTAATNGKACDLTPPDRNTWPGWVEMESEPAFFNAMLKDMGVRGVKIQEVISMEQEMLAMLPQPVHGLIFLFRYRTEDEQVDQSGQGTEHIWFANQVPDFACATIALLNIVNNVPGLGMGKELRDFKEFTKDQSPLERGVMIDEFEFVRRIHNSFARESDILNADLVTKARYDTLKKKRAAAKGRATKEAKKAAQNAAQAPDTVSRRSSQASSHNKTLDNETKRGEASHVDSTKAESSTSENGGGPDDVTFDPGKSDRKQTNGCKEPPRRSARARKPRKDITTTNEDGDEDESGYHFIAYMPIGDHVWKLDGLNHFPEDMGSFGASSNGANEANDSWMDVVSPAIINRMCQFEDGSIEFSLMAVVHDPAATERSALLANVKMIQSLDHKLSAFAEDWRQMDGAETKKEVITGISANFDISQEDIEAAEIADETQAEIDTEDDFLKLIKLRQRIVSEQTVLRSGLRDSIANSHGEDEKARHRRHDYGSFVKGWLGALAENEHLADLL